MIENMREASILILILASAPLWAAKCEALRQTKVPHTIIEKAVVVAAGGHQLPPPERLFQNAWTGSSEVKTSSLPAFCQVLLLISPVPGSAIRVELWLPLDGWNNRFMGVGNGGAAGQINWRAMTQPLARGYAVASTDTGHEGKSGRDFSFGGHPERVIDFHYRAVHELAVGGKAIVKAFYGRGPKYSYWCGSSTGGLQGIRAVQLHPNEFDGVISGAPFIYAVRTRYSQQLRVKFAMDAGAAAIPASKLAQLHQAAVKACDRDDGVADGVIGNPSACKFDPASVPLSPPEVAMARAMYGPLSDPATGAEIEPGYAAGSESGWDFGNSFWGDGGTSPRPGNPVAPAELLAKVEKEELTDTRTAHRPDLGPFFRRGGKLLQIHGWADPAISPYSSIRYYRAVVKALGSEVVKNSYRLYMVPGMAHSRGGNGVTDIDAIRAMERWVEKGQAPDTLTGSRIVSGNTQYTRTICPWPQTAAYRGSGDPNDAAMFSCRAGIP